MTDFMDERDPWCWLPAAHLLTESGVTRLRWGDGDTEDYSRFVAVPRDCCPVDSMVLIVGPYGSTVSLER